MKHYSAREVQQVIEEYSNGLSLRDVSKKTKISYLTVYGWCKGILRSKSEAHRGKIPINFDSFLEARRKYRLTPEQKRHLSEVHKILNRKGKNIPPVQIGKKPWNYIGATKLAERIRKNYKYKNWRKSVFERDNYTCQICGERGKEIEADHFPKYFSYILMEFNIKTLKEAIVCKILWDISNGRTLCKRCHMKTDNYLKNIKNVS